MRARSCLWGFGLALAVGACSPDVRDNIGPRVPVPNAMGQVARAGAPAENLKVELRCSVSAEVIASATTDDDGEYLFTDVPSGDWEIKVSGDEDGDFDSVSRIFGLAQRGDQAVLPELDIHAFGLTLLAPAEASSHPPPSLFDPIEFSWALPSVSIASARVQLYSAAGERVWSSEKTLGPTAVWNGIGNEGGHAGRPVAAGAYYWRVKLELGDEIEARSESYTLNFE